MVEPSLLVTEVEEAPSSACSSGSVWEPSVPAMVVMVTLAGSLQRR